MGPGAYHDAARRTAQHVGVVNLYSYQHSIISPSVTNMQGMPDITYVWHAQSSHSSSTPVDNRLHICIPVVTFPIMFIMRYSYVNRPPLTISCSSQQKTSMLIGIIWRCANRADRVFMCLRDSTFLQFGTFIDMVGGGVSIRIWIAVLRIKYYTYIYT